MTEDFDERDIIWEKIFEIYYDAFYYELLSEKIIHKWILVDNITRLLVALTASGSAISGWKLWNQDGWQYLWLALASLSAVLSIIHATLNVTQKIKDWTDTKRNFASLRNNLELIRAEMSMDRNFDIDEFKKSHKINKDLYGKHYTVLPNDFISTKRLKRKTQEELNHKLKNEIQESHA